MIPRMANTLTPLILIIFRACASRATIANQQKKNQEIPDKMNSNDYRPDDVSEAKGLNIGCLILIALFVIYVIIGLLV